MKNGSKRTMRARRSGPVPSPRAQPVDAERHASRAKILKTRKEPMSSIWHLPVLKPKSVI